MLDCLPAIVDAKSNVVIDLMLPMWRRGYELPDLIWRERETVRKTKPPLGRSIGPVALVTQNRLPESAETDIDPMPCL